MKKLLLPLLLILLTKFAVAQQAATEKSGHYKAADELLIALNLNKSTDEIMEQMLEIQIKNNPVLEPKRAVMQQFFKKYMSWEALREGYIQIYLSEFTENELKDMIAFYRTPTGKKLASKTTVIMMKGAQMGQQKVQEHMSELQELIMKN